ncbi:MAG: hypothetical protein AAF570_16935, partial [Bacteroidota bacterium]
LIRNLEIQKAGEGYRVVLNIPIRGVADKKQKYVTFEKHYFEDPVDEKNGRILKCKFFGLGLYPFLRITDAVEFNDKYNVLLVDNNEEFDFKLEFFNEKGAMPASKSTREVGTNFYEITDGAFDQIQVVASDKTNNLSHTNLLIPNWPDRELGKRSFSISVDFGTTNTHVTLVDNLATDGDKMNDPDNFAIEDHTAYLEKVEVEDGFIPSDIIEPKTVPGVQAYWIPQKLGAEKNDLCRFPTRTSIMERDGFNEESRKILSNVNIHFLHSKRQVPRAVEERDRVITNLKWSENDRQMARIKAFVSQLLHLTRTRILKAGGDPRRSQIIWYYPLSMSPSQRARFRAVWAEFAGKVFKNEKIAIMEMTESAAPYYYHWGMSQVSSENKVACIDIGGGSTDVCIVIPGEKAPIGTSFTFGGNALWGEAFSTVTGSEENRNGVLVAYQEVISSRLESLKTPHRGNQKGLFFYFWENPRTKFSSEEIINYLFANDAHIRFSELIRSDAKFKLLPLLHYSAIVYHVSQILVARNLGLPDVICLTGNAVKALRLVDMSSDLAGVKRFTEELMKKVYHNPDHKIRMILTTEPKEATAKGGLLKLTQKLALPHEMEPMVYSGRAAWEERENRHPVATFRDVNKDVKESV